MGGGEPHLTEHVRLWLAVMRKDIREGARERGYMSERR